MKLRERVIDLSARIAALRDEIDEKRTELVGMERELDTLLNQRTDTPSPPPTTATPPTVAPTGPATNGHQVNASIGERIKAILEAEPDGEYQSEDFERSMPGINVPSIRAALARMTDDGIIVRTRRGYYQAKPA